MNDPRFNSVQPVRVYFVMKENLFSVGLRSVLSKLPSFQFQLVGHSADIPQFLRQPDNGSVDMVFVVINKSSAFSLLQAWCRQHAEVAVIGVAHRMDAATWRKARQAGFQACLAVDERTEDFQRQFQQVLSGQFTWPSNMQESKLQTTDNKGTWFVEKYQLTPREIEVLRLISQAMSTKEIARSLYISDQTVSVHRKNIMRKLGVNNTAAVVRLAVENQLTTDFF